MTDIHTEFIEISQLRIGMFIYLDMGWMEHPFPVSSFEISNQAQLLTLRSLGLEQIRYAPAKSSPALDAIAVPASPVIPVMTELPKIAEARQRKLLLSEQQTSLLVCERQFAQASQTFKRVTELVHAQPQIAREYAETLIQGFLSGMLGEEEAAIRLLSEKAGEKTSLHSINVTIVSLLCFFHA